MPPVSAPFRHTLLALASTLDGLIDMVSRRPQAEQANEVELQAGSNEHKQINFDSTGKIDDEGQFLYRVSGTTRDSNSPRTSATTSRRA